MFLRVFNQMDKYGEKRSSAALCLKRKGREGFFISLMVRVATFRAETLPGGNTNRKTWAGCSNGPVCFGSTCFHKESLCACQHLALQQNLPLASATVPSGESLLSTCWPGAFSSGRPICSQALLMAGKRLHCARAGSCAGAWSASRTLIVQPVTVCRKPRQLLNVWCDFNCCFVTFGCKIPWVILVFHLKGKCCCPYLILISFFCWIWHSKKAFTGSWCGCQTLVIELPELPTSSLHSLLDCGASL